MNKVTAELGVGGDDNGTYESLARCLPTWSALTLGPRGGLASVSSTKIVPGAWRAECVCGEYHQPRLCNPLA